MTPLDHALAYASAGFPVFPAKPAPKPDPYSKAPLLPKESRPGAKDGGHWLASRDEATIRGWWRTTPKALIGFPTGLRSRCVVVDLDPKQVSVTVMLTALTQWCGRLRHEDGETGEVTEPAIAVTQSGGLHLYFAWPDVETFAEVAANLARLGKPVTGTIGNKANLFSAFLKAGECPEALAHIDVRGEGGYVIAPPSVMSDGKRYRWLAPEFWIHAVDALPPLPRRLRGVITGEFIPEAERHARRQARLPQARHVSSEISDVRVRRAVDGAIGKALDRARSAPDGMRNQSVYEAAEWLGRFVRGGFLERGRAESLLLGNLPAGVSATEHKINQTIRNGLDNPHVPAWTPAELGPGRAG